MSNDPKTDAWTCAACAGTGPTSHDVKHAPACVHARTVTETPRVSCDCEAEKHGGIHAKGCPIDPEGVPADPVRTAIEAFFDPRIHASDVDRLMLLARRALQEQRRPTAKDQHDNFNAFVGMLACILGREGQAVSRDTLLNDVRALKTGAGQESPSVVRFELHGEAVALADADAANALRRMLAREREDEREECAKLADSYRANKEKQADACETFGDAEGVTEASVGWWSAKVVAGLIRKRGEQP